MNWLPAIGLALAIGAPGAKEAPKKAEVPTIVGEWECVEFISAGRKATAKQVSEMRLVFEFTVDGRFRVRPGTKDATEGTYSTDTAKDPAQLNYTPAKNAKEIQGIYRVEKDTLTICVTGGGGERPTKFESPAGAPIVLLTYKRVEKKKE
jgi:uncharacterized protein (TIGR03067 family)